MSNMSKQSRLVVSLACLLWVLGAPYATAQTPAERQAQAPVVAAAATSESVRFTAPARVYEMRLEVFTTDGQPLYDSDFKFGNLLDWGLHDQQGQRLADGSYHCVVTIRALHGSLTRRQGALLLADGQPSLQAARSPQSIWPANPLLPSEAGDFLTLPGKTAGLPLTALGHDGQQGRVMSGVGGLSFRMGDFFTGKDVEQMRLTAEGKLGIGVENPQAKLDVAGLIRTSEGIVFPDGSVQTTAYVASGRSISERVGIQREGQRSLAEDGNLATPNGPTQSGSGTANYLTKWLTSSTLGNSEIYETGGNVGIGTTSPSVPLMIQKATGTQFQFGYDASKYVSLGVASNGAVALTPSSGTSQMTIHSAGGQSVLFLLNGNNNNSFIWSKTPGALNTVQNTAYVFEGIGAADNLSTPSNPANGFWNGLQFGSFVVTESSTNRYPRMTMSARAAASANPTDFEWVFETGNTINTAQSLKFKSYTTSSQTGESQGSISFHTSVANALFVGRSGKVGIGTVSPSHNLHVAGGSGTAVYGETSGGITFAGIHGKATASNGYGVWGQYTGTGGGYGVYGSAMSAAGFGVYGQAVAGGIGVFGNNTDLSANSYAGKFDGKVDITNNLTVGGSLSVTGAPKNFLIDHPLDPANKYLYHASIESSEVKNLYDGTVVLDQNGEAVVQLPAWFEALNRDFRYQLTCIGGYAQVYIAEEIADNQFKIAGGRPGMKVSWQVTGNRQDPAIKANPLLVEKEKPEQERGHYLHPEFYGQPEEKSVDWARNPELMRQLKQQREKAEKEKKSN